MTIDNLMLKTAFRENRENVRNCKDETPKRDNLHMLGFNKQILIDNLPLNNIVLSKLYFLTFYLIDNIVHFAILAHSKRHSTRGDHNLVMEEYR